MNEVVKLVVQKTGISEADAKAAVETVISYLKGKLPGPVAGQIDAVLGMASGDALKGAADAAKGLGGFLKKK